MVGSPVTLAVIPFKHSNVESTITQNFEDDLVYHLSKFQGLSVLSYFSTSQWSVGDEEILQKHRVSHVITGSFRCVGGKTLINVQLIEVPQGKVIYDQRVEYKDEEVFELLDQAIVQVTNLLQNQLSESILSRSYQKPVVDLEAYELVLLGNAYLKNGTPQDDMKARSMFEEALKKQPNYARAYAGISSSYFNQWSCQLWDMWEISQNGAKKYALKAIDADANDYQSLCILGRVLLFEKDYDQAEFYLRKSLEMNNNDPATLLEIAFSLMFLGCVDEALGLYEKACRLNPLKEDKYLSVGATLYFENGDFEKALDIGKKLEISNTYIDFPVYMAAACYQLNDEPKAMEYWNIYKERFNEHIYFHNKGSKTCELEWQIEVNPYRDGTQLSEWYSFIKSHEVFADQTTFQSVSAENASLTMVNGSVKIAYSGKTLVLNKTKGLTDIARLLEIPNQDVHCMELMNVELAGNSAISVLDEGAKRAYQKRILELQADMQEADLVNNTVRLENLNQEYDQLVEHLSQSLGLKGESRKVGSSSEKARAAVTLRIRDSIKKITSEDEGLGKHLTNSIKTGLLCSYQPELAVDWEVIHR